MAKDKRLGRGLEALLGAVAAAQPKASDNEYDADANAEPREDSYIVTFPQGNDASSSERSRRGKRSSASELEDEKDRALASFSDGRVAVEIPLSLIDSNPYQPRLTFEPGEMDELQESIALHGMLQPIVVRQQGDRYEIVAGERRYRAAKEAGWEKAPAILIVVDDRQMAELALTENMQRRDLNPIEKAIAFRNYINAYGGTHEELANRLSLDRSTVTNLMRLLDLNEEVQRMTAAGEITMGHARALLPLEDADQLELATRIIAENLNVRQTEQIVRDYLNGRDFPPAGGTRNGAKEVSPHVRELESQFRTWLGGMKVKLTSNDKGKGKLVIQFGSNEDFERIYQALKPRDF